jgi:hypothetical protein
MKNVLIKRTTSAYQGIVREVDAKNAEMIVESGQVKQIHRVSWDNSTLFLEMEKQVTPGALFRGGKIRFEGFSSGNSILAQKISLL